MYQQLSEAESDKQGVEDDDSNISRRALLGVNTARSNLGSVLREQVRCEHFDHNAFPGLVETPPDRVQACASCHPEGRDARSTNFATWFRNRFSEPDIVVDEECCSVAGRSGRCYPRSRRIIRYAIRGKRRQMSSTTIKSPRVLTRSYRSNFKA